MGTFCSPRILGGMCQHRTAKEEQRSLFAAPDRSVKIFNIKLMKGRELGRGKDFFYDEKQAVISSSKDALTRRMEREYIVKDVIEEVDLLREVSDEFRRRKPELESGFVIWMLSFVSSTHVCIQPQLFDFAVRTLSACTSKLRDRTTCKPTFANGR